MARLNIPTGFAQIGLVFTGGGAVHDTVITFGIRDDSSGGVVSTLSLGIADEWAQAFEAILNANIDGVEVRWTTQDNLGNYGTIVTPVTITGSRGFSLPPANTGCMFTKSSAVPFRYGRGRNIVYGLVGEGEIDDSGGLTGTVVGDLTTAADAFLVGLAGNETPMVILHDEALGDALAPSLVTAYTLEPRVATQRRRLRD